MKNLIKKKTDKILKRYKNNKTEDWHWFEPILSYDNGIIPLALLHAFEGIGDKNILNVATEAIHFLEKVTFRKRHISLVGSENWYKRGEKCSQFAQQPIDAMAMVLMFYQAYIVCNNKSFLKKMFTSFILYQK